MENIENRSEEIPLEIKEINLPKIKENNENISQVSLELFEAQIDMYNRANSVKKLESIAISQSFPFRAKSKRYDMEKNYTVRAYGAATVKSDFSNDLAVKFENHAELAGMPDVALRDSQLHQIEEGVIFNLTRHSYNTGGFKLVKESKDYRALSKPYLVKNNQWEEGYYHWQINCLDVHSSFVVLKLSIVHMKETAPICNNEYLIRSLIEKDATRKQQSKSSRFGCCFEEVTTISLIRKFIYYLMALKTTVFSFFMFIASMLCCLSSGYSYYKYSNNEGLHVLNELNALLTLSILFFLTSIVSLTFRVHRYKQYSLAVDLMKKQEDCTLDFYGYDESGKFRIVYAISVLLGNLALIGIVIVNIRILSDLRTRNIDINMVNIFTANNSFVSTICTSLFTSLISLLFERIVTVLARLIFLHQVVTEFNVSDVECSILILPFKFFIWIFVSVGNCFYKCCVNSDEMNHFGQISVVSNESKASKSNTTGSVMANVNDTFGLTLSLSLSHVVYDTLLVYLHDSSVVNGIYIFEMQFTLGLIFLLYVVWPSFVESLIELQLIHQNKIDVASHMRTFLLFGLVLLNIVLSFQFFNADYVLPYSDSYYNWNKVVYFAFSCLVCILHLQISFTSFRVSVLSYCNDLF